MFAGFRRGIHQNPGVHGRKHPSRADDGCFKAPDGAAVLADFFNAQEIFIVAYTHASSLREQLLYPDATIPAPIITEQDSNFVRTPTEKGKLVQSQHDEKTGDFPAGPVKARLGKRATEWGGGKKRRESAQKCLISRQMSRGSAEIEALLQLRSRPHRSSLYKLLKNPILQKQKTKR
jgi:hypothetical protein